MTKNKRIIALALIFVFMFCFAVSGCNNGSANNPGNTVDITSPFSVKLPDTIKSVDSGFVNLEKFKAQSKTNDANIQGIIECPFYDVTYSNGQKIYAYSVPSVSSELHSFGYLEATKDMFPITVTITTDFANYSLESAVVIPEKFGIVPTVSNNRVTFTINSFDHYTVLFNGKFNFDRPFTLFVREYEKIEVPQGYELIEFKPGIHYIDKINVNKSNVMVYLHTGAYLVAKQPSVYNEKNTVDLFGMNVWNGVFYAVGQKNIIIKGNGILDLSNLTWHARCPINFSSCSNITIEGITIVDSSSWSLFMADCKDLYINNVILLGYRTNSDGIVITCCRNVLVENCFVRSGDDLIEVKATLGNAPNTDTGGSNITFRHNQAWAEKTRCFGFIQESEMDVDGVLYEDCSALYQDATWDNAMGTFLVIVGDGSNIKNVTFRNCDAYYVEGYVMNVSLGKNQWTITNEMGTISGITFENIKFYSYYDEDKPDVKNLGIRLQNTKEDGSADDYHDITFKNLSQDNLIVNGWDDVKVDQVGPFRNITLNGIPFVV